MRTRMGWRRWFRYRGMLVLVLWQVPAPVGRDPETGLFRFAFGVGGGTYEIDTFNCDGSLADARSGEHREVGVTLEKQLTKRTQIEFAAGVSQDDGTEVHFSERGSFPYFGARPSIEGGKIGIGAGALFAREEVAPTGFLRIGNRDRLHLLLDFAPLDAPIGTTGLGQIGLGYNNGALSGAGGTAGVVLCYFCIWDDGTGIFAKGHVPVTDRIDITAGLVHVSGHVSSHSGVTIGARTRLKDAP